MSQVTNSCASPFLLNQDMLQHLETLNEDPNESGNITHVKQNRKSKKHKVAQMDTSQNNLSKFRDHFCLPKSVMSEEQGVGKGIAGDRSVRP